MHTLNTTLLMAHPVTLLTALQLTYDFNIVIRVGCIRVIDIDAAAIVIIEVIHRGERAGDGTGERRGEESASDERHRG